MRNPLHKRYLPELKKDFGKYLVIFLFMILLISLVSGFLIADNNLKITYDEGFTKYNLEDGHLSFEEKPDPQILSDLEEKSGITLYDLRYFEETPAGSTVNIRVYMDRDAIDTECLLSGRMPETPDEIALDRLFARNNDLAAGDKITLGQQTYTITGMVALVDYSCLFEKNSDMMFDSLGFGVAIVTPEGFDAARSRNITYNYAWKYAEEPDTEKAADRASDDLLDDMEDVLLAYDAKQLQSQADVLYDRADALADRLEDLMNAASDEIEDRMSTAAEDALDQAMDGLSDEDMLRILIKKSGISKQDLITGIICSDAVSAEDKVTLLMAASQLSTSEFIAAVAYSADLSGDSEDGTESDSEDESDLQPLLDLLGLDEETAAEALFDEAEKRTGSSKEALIAEQLGITERQLTDIEGGFEDLEADLDDLSDTENDRTIDPEDLRESDDEDSDSGDGPKAATDFSTDSLRDLVRKLGNAHLIDTSEILAALDEIDSLKDFEFDTDGLPEIRDYLPRYLNQAITFTGEDMGSDGAMFALFNYIVIVILAFVFAVTTSNTIASEAGVIGTLRASGYSRGELIRHYLTLPVFVTVVAAVIGNVLGYTVFADLFTGIYCNSYSLASSENHWNNEAFLNTTVLPLILMFFINLFILTRKMQLSPLQFLRGELSETHKRRAFPLPDRFSFFTRFRLRILIQNLPAYLTLVMGVFLGAVIVVFGTMFGPLIDDYAELVKESEIAKYQYILSEQTEVSDPSAEKYCMTSFDYQKSGYKTDEISVFGIEDGSRYVTADMPQGEVLISNGFADKYGISSGDTLTLEGDYGAKTYRFIVGGTYQYDAGMAVFMSRDDYLRKFGEDEDYFTGYFSDEELTELYTDPETGEERDVVYTVITEKDLTKLADQMTVSMGEFMSLFQYFGAIMFLLLMYLMTRQIIEKNMLSIALTKILGFRNREIGVLYLVITSLVVVFALLISIPLTDAALRWCFSDYLYTEMSGYIPYIVDNSCYVTMFLMGIVCYAVVCAAMVFRIGKIPKAEALKNRE